MKQIFLFLFFPVILFGQFDRNGFIGNNNGKIYIINDNHLEVYDYNQKLIDEVPIESVPLDFGFPKSFQSVFIKDNLYISSVNGGMMYSIVNDSLKRIDNSFNHKMTIQSAVFTHRDTIFKFGGYGYWSSRKFMTYFSFDTMEWEFYKQTGSNSPPGSHNFNWSISGDDFYFFNGRIVDVNNGLMAGRNDNIWKFDFTSRSWSNLGKVNLSDYNFNMVKSNVDKFGSSYVFDTSISENSVYKLDFQNNILSTFDIPNKYSGIGRWSFIENDTIYELRPNIFVKTPLKEIFNESTREDTKLYNSSQSLIDGLVRVLLYFILIVVVLYFLNDFNIRSKPRLTSQGIKVKRELIRLSDIEIKILHKLLKSTETLSVDLYNTVEDKSLSYPQNNRIKVSAIKSINTKIYKSLGVQSFIDSKKLLEDKRVAIYFISRKNLILV
jgi:hypothetical protein